MPKHKLLLVDDEPSITQVLKLGLERHGFSVDTYNNPKQALTQFKPGYYDAIVLDVRMPEINGFELARAIWAIDESARICFMTAFEIYEAEAKIVFNSFKTHCFIKKPIMPSALAEHIEAHFMLVKQTDAKNNV